MLNILNDLVFGLVLVRHGALDISILTTFASAEKLVLSNGVSSYKLI